MHQINLFDHFLLIIQAIYTCSKLISTDAKGLHLHLEGVDGEIQGHAQSLHLTAHVREAQGPSQVVQALVPRHKGFWSRG